MSPNTLRADEPRPSFTEIDPECELAAKARKRAAAAFRRAILAAYADVDA